MYLTTVNIESNVSNLRRIAKSIHSHDLVLIRDGDELLKQKVSLIRKKPTQWQAAQEQYTATLPSESLYVIGSELFDVQSGDRFVFDKKNWEVVEAGAVGGLNAVCRVRAEMRPS